MIELNHTQGYCKECHEEVESITVDQGYGPTDQGYHHYYVEASPCCEAEVAKEEDCEWLNPIFNDE